MKSRFVKMDDAPYARCDIEEYAQMDIEKFYRDALPKIARGKKEKWHHFQDRKYDAEKALDTFVFGKFYGDFFELKSIPDEYSDYQYSKSSEFGYISQSGMLGGISISIDSDEIINFINGEHSDLKRTVRCDRIEQINVCKLNKINVNRIGDLFNYWKTRKILLDNTVNYVINNCDDNSCISVTRWLTSTGKSGRTKEIESLTEGCHLSWTLDMSTSSTEISVLSPNGTIIGEINWKTDDQIEDSEFNEVYEPLLRNGSVDIKSIDLKKIIPHNAPGGRPRKALAQVIITLHVTNLEITNDFTNRAKHDIQSMRVLAAIDYNRKCDIIEGKTPEKLSALEELFSDDEFPAENPFVTYDIFRSESFLSGYSFTINELEEIWSIYMPTYFFCHKRDPESPLFKDGKTRLFCSRHIFNYVLDYEQTFIVLDGESMCRNILRLSLYRNQ